MANCALRNRIKQLCAATQNDEDTSPALVAADVVPVLFEASRTFDASTFERRPFQSTLGRRASITGTVLSSINFQIELKGAGTAGLEPNYSKFLLAAGFAPVKLAELTVTSTTGLSDGDIINDAVAPATGRVFVNRLDPTKIIVVPLTGTFGNNAITTTGGYSDTITATDANYGFGYEPYSKSSRTLELAAPAAYQAGEHVLGGTSGAIGRVIYMGTSKLWVQPIGSVVFVNSETITGQVSTVVGTTVAANSNLCSLPTPPLTAKLNEDGVRFDTKGARARVNFNFGAVGEPVRMEFELQGVLPNNPVDAVAFAEVDDALIPPKFQGATVELTDANNPGTPFVPIIASFSCQVDNTLAPRQDATSALGLRSVIISDRDFSGSFDPEFTAVASYDWHGKWFGDVLEDLFVEVGAAAGNTVDLYAPRLQITALGSDVRDDILVAGTSFKLTQIVGDDAIKLVIR